MRRTAKVDDISGNLLTGARTAMYTGLADVDRTFHEDEGWETRAKSDSVGEPSSCTAVLGLVMLKMG